MLLPPCHKFLDSGLVADVDFVDYDDDRTLQIIEPAHIVFVLIRGLYRIRDIQDNVGVADGPVHEFHHVLLEPVVRLQDTGRVGVDYLPVLPVHYTHDTVSGSLRLGGDYGEFLSYQCVHEGGFPDIRVPYDINES